MGYIGANCGNSQFAALGISEVRAERGHVLLFHMRQRERGVLPQLKKTANRWTMIVAKLGSVIALVLSGRTAGSHFSVVVRYYIMRQKSMTCSYLSA